MIGRISNISFIPKNCNKDQVLGFDTGPGMCLIDSYVNLIWYKNYDLDGKLANRGSIDFIML